MNKLYVGDNSNINSSSKDSSRKSSINGSIDSSKNISKEYSNHNRYNDDTVYDTFNEYNDTSPKHNNKISEYETKNRIEIRLKDKKADKMVNEIIEHKDNIGEVIYSLMDRYIQFIDDDNVDGNINGNSNDIDSRWKLLLTQIRQEEILTIKPKKYTMDKTYLWLSKQVAPTIKMMIEMDSINDTDILGNIIDNTKLQQRHREIIQQQSISVDDIIY